MHRMEVVRMAIWLNWSRGAGYGGPNAKRTTPIRYVDSMSVRGFFIFRARPRASGLPVYFGASGTDARNAKTVSPGNIRTLWGTGDIFSIRGPPWASGWSIYVWGAGRGNPISKHGISRVYSDLCIFLYSVSSHGLPGRPYISGRWIRQRR